MSTRILALRRTLFRRLEDKPYRAREFLPHAHQHLGHAKRHRHVYVVPAGVFHALVLGPVGHVERLLDGQRVHVRAHSHHGPGLRAFQHRDDTVVAHACPDLVEAQRFQFRRDHTGRALLAVRKLGMHVEVTALLHERRRQRIRRRRDAIRRRLRLCKQQEGYPDRHGHSVPRLRARPLAGKRIKVRPTLERSRAALEDLLEKIRVANCRLNPGYLKALGTKTE